MEILRNKERGEGLNEEDLDKILNFAISQNLLDTETVVVLRGWGPRLPKLFKDAASLLGGGNE